MTAVSLPALGLPMSAPTVEAVVSEFYGIAKETKGVIGKKVSKFLNLALRSPEVLLSSQLSKMGALEEKKAGFHLNLSLLSLPPEQRALAGLQLHHVEYISNNEGLPADTKNALVLASLGQFLFKGPNLFQNETTKPDFLVNYQKFTRYLSRYGVEESRIAEIGQYLVAGDLTRQAPAQDDPTTKALAVMVDAKRLALLGISAPLPENWSLPTPEFSCPMELREVLENRQPLTQSAKALGQRTGAQLDI